jgi:hypothetical protein
MHGCLPLKDRAKSGRAAATRSNLMKNIPKMADIFIAYGLLPMGSTAYGVAPS